MTCPQCARRPLPISGGRVCVGCRSARKTGANPCAYQRRGWWTRPLKQLATQRKAAA